MQEVINDLLFLKEKLYNGIYKNKLDCIDKAIEIVKQEAEEFATDTNVGSNGWIPVSERLPEDKELYLGINELKQYALVHVKNGKMVDYMGRDCNVVAWQPLPEPYHQKGE